MNLGVNWVARTLALELEFEPIEVVLLEDDVLLAPHPLSHSLYFLCLTHGRFNSTASVWETFEGLFAPFAETYSSPPPSCLDSQIRSVLAIREAARNLEFRRRRFLQTDSLFPLQLRTRLYRRRYNYRWSSGSNYFGWSIRRDLRYSPLICFLARAKVTSSWVLTEPAKRVLVRYESILLLKAH